ncbi:divergent PAP2 family protein [Synechococcus sp. PCC 7336]|uniref:divergent PAP2 family protein n=1 Tax=Synechococcus sp. PCC 7336 TaxID=195250 RepID=UPI00034B9FC5|nr:divergent PAP2 family protein [Synechococcus sp. PCC 7336]
MLQELAANRLLWMALLSSLIAQAFKLLIRYLQSGKIDFHVLVETGGMPSSHAALVTALAFGVGLQEGWDSVLFAVSSVFAFIVMYDAAGIRQAAGKQARVLNQMLEELFGEKHEFKEVRLKELLGHTPIQVIVGAALGGTFACLSMPLWMP